MANKKRQQTSVQTKAAVQALEYLLATGYISRKRLYFENFMRGLFFSFGSVLGATLLIALLLWILSLFDSLPWIGHIITTLRQTIQNSH